MLKVFRIIVMYGLLLTALSACGSTNEVKLEADDDGSQVELKAGQTLIVSLEGNPTTGYMWEAEDLDEQVLRQAGETEFKPESDAIGAGGVQTLRFETVKTGQTTLKLVYHRSWEADVEPAETFSVQVVVR
ncbi:protease inhibitor I42 family protein [Chloroflexota bacterium]